LSVVSKGPYIQAGGNFVPNLSVVVLRFTEIGAMRKIVQ
jgi:hypothetical protein